MSATEMPDQIEIKLAAKASAIQMAATNQMFCEIISRARLSRGAGNE
jgi:hypothetical protein